MKIPNRIKPLVEEGLVDAVLRQLMSGKEAQVYLVRCADELRCAKVYNGPIIIDLPQAIDPAGNTSAELLLERDVENITRYFSQFAPELRGTDYGKEIWSIYRSGKLHPDISLTGRFARSEKPADVSSVVREISDVANEEAARHRYGK